MKSLARLALFVVAVVVCSRTAAAQDREPEETLSYAPPRATARLQTPAPIWVNQKAEIEVTLWRDDAEPDKAAPDFGEVRVKNAIALRTEYAPPPEIRRDGDTLYLLQKRRYLVFPQGVGVIEVPSVEVSWVRDDGSRMRVETEALDFEAQWPPGAGLGDYVVADSLEVRESMQGDLKHLRVGDSFARTITVKATGTDAMMVPATSQPTPQGLVAYPSASEVTTTVQRGLYTAKRVDSITYVAEAWGSHELPAVEVRWLNPMTRRWETDTVDARTVRVHVNPELGITAFGTLDSNARRLGGLIVILMLAWGAYLVLQRRLRPGLARAPQAPTGPSEKRLFWRALRKAYRGDAMATLNATYAWIAVRRGTDGGPLTLDALARRAPDIEAPAIDLQSTLFSAARGERWKGHSFASALRKARHDRSSAPHKGHTRVPPLNPESPPSGR